MKFPGKVALVSGAGSGIGRAVAVAFAREGASVALLGRSEAKLHETAAMLPGGQWLVVVGRHEDPEEAGRAVARTVETFGGIDVLVNNAGAYVAGTMEETTPVRWHEALEANLSGPFTLSREALPHLRRRKGCVVNVSSSLGLHPIPGALSYCVAKAGLNMLTQALALEEGCHRVRVNVVCPGVIDTPIHRRRVGDDPARVKEFLASAGSAHPIGRVGRPEEVASLVLFLASEESAFTTGSVVAVDGGISLG